MYGWMGGCSTHPYDNFEALLLTSCSAPRLSPRWSACPRVLYNLIVSPNVPPPSSLLRICAFVSLLHTRGMHRLLIPARCAFRGRSHLCMPQLDVHPACVSKRYCCFRPVRRVVNCKPLPSCPQCPPLSAARSQAACIRSAVVNLATHSRHACQRLAPAASAAQQCVQHASSDACA